MTTVFTRIGEWATGLFNADELQLIATDIEKACVIVADEAPKVEAFISMLEAVLATLTAKQTVAAIPVAAAEVAPPAPSADTDPSVTTQAPETVPADVVAA